jgi:hypothetical protein
MCHTRAIGASHKCLLSEMYMVNIFLLSVLIFVSLQFVAFCESLSFLTCVLANTEGCHFVHLMLDCLR